MRRLRRKTRKNLMVTIVAAVAVTIVIAAAIKEYYDRTNVNKPSAKDYLKVEHIGSIGEFYNNNRTVIIREMGLRVTAIGGNATYIVIDGLPTSSDTELPTIEFLKQGDSKDLDILLKPYSTSLNETTGSFPVEFTIGCKEAEPCDITIYLKPEDIIGPHY